MVWSHSTRWRAVLNSGAKRNFFSTPCPHATLTRCMSSSQDAAPPRIARHLRTMNPSSGAKSSQAR
eukprot:5927703-Pyramimonas_sp.AAC.1